MKKALIGTTALVAGGLIAGSAAAADLIPAPAPEIVDDGFSYDWNGFIRSGFYFGDVDCTTAGGGVCFVAANTPPGFDPDYNSTTVPLNGELQIFAEQTLANGLRVGGEIDMNVIAGGYDLTLDEMWLFIDGHYGQVRLGAKEGALDSLGSGALPSWGAFNGSMDGPDMVVVSGMIAGATGAVGGISGNGSHEDLSGDNNKIVYLTPTLGGVNLAVSFAPEAGPTTDTLPGGRFLAINGDDNTEWFNEWSFGANAKHTWGETTLLIAGGFTTAEAGKNNVGTVGGGAGDVTIWKIAGSIKHSYGGVGAWYTHTEFDTDANTINNALTDSDRWGVQANVISGDYTFGGGYSNITDSRHSPAAALNTDAELEQYGFGVSRKMATGFEVGANATIQDFEGSYDSNTATRGTNADGWLAGVFAAIAF